MSEKIKGKPMAYSIEEAVSICEGYFLQGCEVPLSIFEVLDTTNYEHGFNIVRGDESSSGRKMFGECKVKLAKVVYKYKIKDFDQFLKSDLRKVLDDVKPDKFRSSQMRRNEVVLTLICCGVSPSMMEKHTTRRKPGVQS